MTLFVEHDIVARLKANVAIDAMISGKKIYPLSLPQNAPLPAVVYQKISSVPGYNIEGENGITTDRIQIDSWAESYETAKELAHLIRQSISGFTGESAVNILGMFLDNEQDFDEMVDGKKLYRISSDYMVHYKMEV